MGARSAVNGFLVWKNKISLTIIILSNPLCCDFRVVWIILVIIAVVLLTAGIVTLKIYGWKANDDVHKPNEINNSSQNY